jgi:hypothetical protein
MPGDGAPLTGGSDDVTTDDVKTDDVTTDDVKTDDAAAQHTLVVAAKVPELQFLHDVWTFRFHDPNDPNWNLNSYVRLADVATIDDFWSVHAAVRGSLCNGIYFVMREHVFPCWDDKHNVDGGCISIKVLKEDMLQCWEHLVMHLLGERLVADDGAWAVVNGISTSPKRYFCIIKLWLRDGSRTERRQFRLPPGYGGEVLYKSNIENIRGNAHGGG